jgi:signal recognition particle GTPase
MSNPLLATVAEYRVLLAHGQAAVRGQLRTTPNDQSLISGLREYRRIFGMLDAMTLEERLDPISVMDSGRIRRVAQGAGVADQEVIQLLFSFRDFCEQVGQARWRQQRGSA